MLSDVYFPRINGVSTSIQTFNQSLVSQGHSVTLIAPDYPQEHIGDFEIIRVPSRKLPFDPEDRLMSLRAIKKLAPELRKRHFDLIHIQTPFVAHYAGVYLSKKLGIKTVVSYHTFFEAYFEKYLPWAPKAWLRSVARSYSRKQCNQVNGVISPSRPMLEKLKEYGMDNRAAIIPTGLPPACFETVPDNQFRAKNRIREDAQLLLYVGRVAHEKNIDFLISMFRLVADRSDAAELLIAGEGPALRSLQKQAEQAGLSERIHFVGYLDRNTELLECYQHSDIFVFASETETQGLVLLEAMAAGLPVISCASMGSLDVLRDGEGCHIAPLIEDEFAERVLSLINDPQDAMRLSGRGRQYATTWSAEAKAADMLDFYQQVTDTPRYDQRG
jgi:glycosyltransferase involved in cell wall biosynthesis